MYLIILFFISAVNCIFDPDLHDKFQKLPLVEFIKHFNSQNTSWIARNYDEGGFALGDITDQEAFDTLEVIDHGSVKNLPKEFDARKQWPKCPLIGKVRDQGSCKSCWMFSTTNSLSDRICIKTGKVVDLAETDLECCFDCYKDKVCDHGGDTVKALNFWKDKGLVTETCKPYSDNNFNERKCNEKCNTTSINYKEDKHYGVKTYSVNNKEDNIMAELVSNGPVCASFVVYEDFLMYDKGVYEHKFGMIKGNHAVRLIGYGVEDNTPYWLAVNSWGESKGIKGFYKIKRYDKDLKFEERIVSGLPKI